MHDAELFEQQAFGVVNDYTNLFHQPFQDKPLERLLETAEKNHVSVVTPNVAHLLETLACLKQPRCILELGTAYGVSSYHMLKGLKGTAKLVTIDLVAERQQVAHAFLEEEGMCKRHEIIFCCDDFRTEGYLEALAKQHGPFDFIFMDAAKGQYAYLLNLLLPYVQVQGTMIFDNIFLNGWLVADAYPNHRQKTAFLRMKQFLASIRIDERFSNVLLPLDDGALVLVKKGES